MLKFRGAFLGELLVYSFPICFQFSNFKNIGSVIPLYTVYIALFLWYIIYNRDGLYLPKYMFIMVTGVFISYLFVPLFSGFFQIQTIFYAAYAELLVLDTYIAASIYSNSFSKEAILRKISISNGILLSYQLITNRIGYNYTAFMTVFNGIRQGRSYFGFTHPNLAGMYLVMEFILIYVLLKKSKKMSMKLIYVLVEIFIVISICMTGSRSSLYSCIIFLTLELLGVVTGVFKSSKKIIYPLAVIFLVFLSVNYLGDSLLQNGASRVEGLESNSKTIYENGTLWFGNGGLSISSNVAGISHSDNWFMSMIINLGLIGFIILLISLLSVIIKALIYRMQRFYLFVGIKSLVIMILIYSFAENMLFVPGVGISWLCWFFIQAQILDGKHYTKVVISGHSS